MKKEKCFWVNYRKAVIFLTKIFFLQIIFFKNLKKYLAFSLNVFSFFKIKNKSIIFVSFENLRRHPLSHLHFNVLSVFIIYV